MMRADAEEDTTWATCRAPDNISGAVNSHWHGFRHEHVRRRRRNSHANFSRHRPFYRHLA